ncbi:MAG: lasso peptide biosynthesis B2 protein [Leptolyngbya sp. SIO1D8]|nr:lasso peptide biosynthesis B2 protein [Leptolyngbya sp. SIO1D8]
MLKRLVKLRRLKRQDLLLLSVAFLLLGMIRIGLWMMPFHRLLKLLMEASQSLSFKKSASLFFPQGDPFSSETFNLLNKTGRQSCQVAKIVWSVNVASRYLPGKTKCLARALATQVLMNGHRYVSELRIGVDKTPEGEFRAHAWIEYQGRVIIGNLNDLAHFKPLFAYRGMEP